MSKFRSILAVALAFVMVMFVAFTHPADAKPKKAKAQTYAAEQIAQIQAYASDIQAMRDRFPELQSLIEQEDYIFARNFIHGPLGELRFKMLTVARDLFPEARKTAEEASKDVFKALNALDRAGIDKDYRAAARAYTNLNKALDSFFSVVPQG
ncbi:MAG: photosystem II protein PsbQ [Alkalinema sp. CACIAM 70d]|nr:MAG: photosystem II protein PsbQ [Alkalinema sp. CACIAM 70d]